MQNDDFLHPQSQADGGTQIKQCLQAKQNYGHLFEAHHEASFCTHLLISCGLEGTRFFAAQLQALSCVSLRLAYWSTSQAYWLGLHSPGWDFLTAFAKRPSCRPAKLCEWELLKFGPRVAIGTITHKMLKRLPILKCIIDQSQGFCRCQDPARHWHAQCRCL